MKTEMLFKLSNLNSNLALTLGHFIMPALGALGRDLCDTLVSQGIVDYRSWRQPCFEISNFASLFVVEFERSKLTGPSKKLAD